MVIRWCWLRGGGGTTKDRRGNHRYLCHQGAGDLEEPELPQEIFENLRRVGILVNNAGFGFRGKWWEIPVEQDMATIRPEYRRCSAPHKALPVVPGVANKALVAARRFLSETAQAS
jgi:hypothetical protein